jgi:hypothetical protein
MHVAAKLKIFPAFVSPRGPIYSLRQYLPRHTAREIQDVTERRKDRTTDSQTRLAIM